MSQVGKRCRIPSNRSRKPGSGPKVGFMRRFVIAIMVVAALGAGTAVAMETSGGSATTNASVTQYGGKDQGCTPGFWKNNTNTWVGFSPSDSFNAVFGVN